MNSFSFLAEWAVRSCILILGGALLIWVAHLKDPALRLAGWIALLIGSLLIPAVTMTLPVLPLRVLDAASPLRVQTQAPVQMDFSAAAPAESVTPMAEPPRFNWYRAGLTLYAIVAGGMLLRLFVGLILSWRIRRRSRRADRNFLVSRDIASPATLGIFRPVVVLPEDWAVWEPSRLDSVLAHELSHIDRRDPAIQLLSAVHRALLWFSPPVWFLHSKIVRAAEEVSDDAGIAATADRVAYAEILVEFMRRRALRRHDFGVPMSRYGSTDRRIQRILDSSKLSRRITRSRIAAILAIAMPLTYLAAASRPQMKAPQTIAQAVSPVGAPRPATAPQTERPKFDAASIKPCDPNAPPPGGRGRGTAGADHYRRNCISVRTLIQNAYIRFADGTGLSPTVTALTKIEGGPGWIDSDQYTIEAESETAMRPQMMDGPMMQTLLEDRFHLRVHRETRDSQIYDLTVAKGGSKVLPFKQGPCIRSDFAGSPMPYSEPSPEMANQQCWFFLTFTNQSNKVISARNATLADLTASLTVAVNRLVVDKTGITGNVDFKLVYSDGGDPGSAEFEQPPILTAIQQQLGLKLEPARGPRDYLIIDSISRLSSN